MKKLLIYVAVITFLCCLVYGFGHFYKLYNYRTLVTQARELEDSYEYDAAIEKFKEIEQKYPEDLTPLLSLVPLYIGKDDFINAQKMAERIVTLSPDEATGYVLRAHTYLLTDKAKAQADFKKAQSMGDSSWFYFMGESSYYCAAGDLKNALNSANKVRAAAAEEKIQNAGLYLPVLFINLKLGQYEKVLEFADSKEVNDFIKTNTPYVEDALLILNGYKLKALYKLKRYEEALPYADEIVAKTEENYKKYGEKYLIPNRTFFCLQTEPDMYSHEMRAGIRAALGDKKGAAEDLARNKEFEKIEESLRRLK
ncbi:tetratricopeptide (TPR) repeat protein [Elusimicrobium posterum]|uniref:tetratricopeptide repeat protein n=1 Tax=Elusimicrobium posterum TaxID=3116653 RepID=UPI003C75FDD9